MERLTSPANPLLKELRRAAARGGLTRDGFCLAETFHLVDEALRSGCEVEAVLATESALERLSGVGFNPRGASAPPKIVVLPDPLFASIAPTETSQGVLALVRPPAFHSEDLRRGTPLVCVLDGLQDPGNVGAIVRAAEAFGASGIVALKGTANPFNPKAVRASAGSLFRLPVSTGLEPQEALPLLEGLRRYAAMPGSGTPPAEADLTQPCALIIGSEGHGVSPALQDGAVNLCIPTRGVESLNASLAAGVLLYEARRQRMME